MAGRVWKWTPRCRRVVLDGLRQGLTRSAACAEAGGSVTRFHELLADDRSFSEAVTLAEAEAEATAIRVAVPWPPQSAADARYWLQRRRRDDWSEAQTVKHQGGPDALIAFNWAAALRQQTATEDAPDDDDSGA